MGNSCAWVRKQNANERLRRIFPKESDVITLWFLLLHGMWLQEFCKLRAELSEGVCSLSSGFSFRALSFIFQRNCQQGNIGIMVNRYEQKVVRICSEP